MNSLVKSLTVLILVELALRCDCHFDKKKHYRLSLKQSQMFNIHDSIKQFSEDREHLQEDLNEYYNFKVDTNDMTEEEKSYFYFVLHDFDKNKKLDGLELLLSMNHQFDDPTDDFDLPAAPKPVYNPDNPHAYYEHHQKAQSNQALWNERFEADSKFVDIFLDQYDKNKDGYLSFGEFMVARNEEGQ